MTVGVLVLRVGITDSRSLKDKRSVLLRLFGRIRRVFNVSMSEVGDRNIHDRAVIAVASVNSDKAYLNATLLTVKHEVEMMSDIVLSDFTIEFL